MLLRTGADRDEIEAAFAALSTPGVPAPAPDLG